MRVCVCVGFVGQFDQFYHPEMDVFGRLGRFNAFRGHSEVVREGDRPASVRR